MSLRISTPLGCLTGITCEQCYTIAVIIYHYLGGVHMNKAACVSWGIDSIVFKVVTSIKWEPPPT